MPRCCAVASSTGKICRKQGTKPSPIMNRFMCTQHYDLQDKKEQDSQEECATTATFDNECPICYDTMTSKNKVKLKCGQVCHCFHDKCISEWIKARRWDNTFTKITHPTCPMCRTPIDQAIVDKYTNHSLSRQAIELLSNPMTNVFTSTHAIAELQNHNVIVSDAIRGLVLRKRSSSYHIPTHMQGFAITMSVKLDHITDMMITQRTRSICPKRVMQTRYIEVGFDGWFQTTI